MTDAHNAESPLGPERAPDHGPEFWNQLDAALQADQALLSDTASVPLAVDATTQVPQLATIDGHGTDTSPTSLPAPRVRSRWPLAAAAAVMVLLGLGFLGLRGPNGQTPTTEVVSAADPNVSADAASGGTTAGGDAEAASAADDRAEAPDNSDADATSGASIGGVASSGGVAAGDGAASDGGTTEGAPASSDASDARAVVAATSIPAPPIPDFASARGAVGEPAHLPLDGRVAADGTYLANWNQRTLTWFAVADPTTNCANSRFSEILYVNGSGITQAFRDPQPRFSGDVSHFVVHPDRQLAAWLVACGNQLELFVATLEPTGEAVDITLAWLGEASTSSALVLWDDAAVSLNAIEPNGQAFSVEYNVDTGLVSRNGGPARIMLEAGAPAERSLTPIAASPDGGLTYFTGTAPAGTLSACSEFFGSGQSDTLWLRQGEGQWRLATADDYPLGTVTAAALHTEQLRIAFADVCAGESGRVLVGTQLADGRIGDLEEIDLSPFVPGFAAQLFWVDDTTLRIETDNTEFGFGTVRFDYRVDQDLIVQLD